MLLRLACSYINRQYNDPDKRPVTVTAGNLKKLQDDIDVELAYYFRHIVSEIQEFENFFNICNRCFVESIEKYGKSLGKKKYFWNEIKSTYPALFDVLHRIKVYRHSSDHLELNPDVAKKYKEFWNEDTAGVTDFEEQRFVIQQKLLEAFLSAIQTEIDSIS